MHSIHFVRPSPSASELPARTCLFTYDLACGLALYSEFVGRDQSAPEMDPNKNSQHYSDKAMAVLRQAVDRGWKEADWTERDPELGSLRARPDFQELIKTLRRKPGSAPDGPITTPTRLG